MAKTIGTPKKIAEITFISITPSFSSLFDN